MPKFLFYKSVVVLITIWLLVSGLYFNKETLACELVGYSHFEEIGNNVFVDQSINVAQQVQLVTFINKAKDRVAQVYGEPESNVRFIFSNDDLYWKLGFNKTGMQRSSLNKECVFIGPNGMNVDVISHEFVHAEVRHRLDFWTEILVVPAWFIEGTAIIVDHRTPFLAENIHLTEQQIENVKKVFYLSDFPNTSVIHYQASKVAVEQLEIGKLYSSLERLNQGASFNEVFNVN